MFLRSTIAIAGFGLALISCELSQPWAQGAEVADADLVERLKDPSQAEAAEAHLVRKGAQVLPLLEAAAKNAGGEQLVRLKNVMAALKAIAPSQVTLQKRSITLKDALHALHEQTGVLVSDVRSDKTNPNFNIFLTNATFWEALDAIAREAKVVVSLYQGRGQIALVDGTYRPCPVSHSGLFRTAAKRITVSQDLESGARFCTLTLEVAWEPRLQPFRIENGATKVFLTTAGNKKVEIDQDGTGHTDAHGGLAMELILRFPAPARSVAKLDRMIGSLNVVTPCRMLTFSFDALSKLSGAGEEKKSVQEGVVARITRLNPDDDPWDVEIALDNPGGGAKFESYQSWLVNNEVFLENKKTKERVSSRGMRVLRGTHPHARVLYYFGNSRNRLGKPASWKLVCRVPGRIVTLPVRFELKNLRLP
jgi:hypothetical protein